MNNIPLGLILLSISFYPTLILTNEGNSLGYFSECSQGHGFEGEVFVLNEREILIPEFYYNGRGPSVWFHAMRRGVQGGIHSSNESFFYTLPFPGASCDRVKGHNYNGEEIKLKLPVSIYDLETIGMFDYQSCQNYGNVSIPHDLVVEPAPQDLLENRICPKPHFKACLENGETKNGGKNCTTVELGVKPLENNNGTEFNPGSKILPNILIFFPILLLLLF